MASTGTALSTSLGWLNPFAKSKAVATKSNELILHDGYLESALRGALINRGVYEYSALRISIVYACLRMISGVLAQLPIRIMQGTMRSAPEVERLFNKAPSPRFSGPAFWEWVGFKTLLQGNAYAEIVRMGNVPVELRPHEPDRVRVTEGAGGGGSVWMGVDLASKLDYAGISYLWQYDGYVWMKQRYYLPRKTVEDPTTTDCRIGRAPGTWRFTPERRLTWRRSTTS